MIRTILIAACITILLTAAQGMAADYGTYLKLMEKAEGNFETVVADVQKGLKAAGWDIVATYQPGLPEHCDCRSSVIIFSSRDFQKAVMAHGPKAAFAAALRMSVSEDRSGISIALANPASLNRTMVHETKMDRLSRSVNEAVAKAVASAVRGRSLMEQAGEMRQSGAVAGQGGGEFRKKIVPIHTSHSSRDSNFRKIVREVRDSITENRKNWTLIYELDLSDYDAVVFGIAEEGLEARAMGAVLGSQGPKAPKGAALYQSAAFPIEIVVYKEKRSVKVVTLDELYRMKLYFRDAGDWAFLKDKKAKKTLQSQIGKMVSEEFVKGAGN